MHGSCRLHAVMVPRVPVKEGPVIPVTGKTVSRPHIRSRPFVRQSILDLDDWWLWECKGVDMPTWKEQLRAPIMALGLLACRGIYVCVWNECWPKLSDVQHDNFTPPLFPRLFHPFHKNRSQALFLIDILQIKLKFRICFLGNPSRDSFESAKEGVW